MNMTSNIWPEVAALCFGLVLSLNLRVRYADATEANRFYRQMVYAVTAAAFVDVAAVVLHALTVRIPAGIFVCTTTAFYVATILAAYCLLRYITMRAKRQHGRFFRAQRYILAADMFLLALNLFTGFFFSYDADGNILYGTGHLVVSYGVALWFLLSACVMQIAHKGRYTLLQRIVLLSAGTSMLLAFVIQFFFFRDQIFSYAVGIFSAYLVFFAVEMPVYRQIEETTRHLTMVRKEAEEAANRAHAASLAKSNFLASTSHEIRTPMNAIMGINDLIARGTADEKIRAASAQIRTAGANLLQIINDVLDYSRIESGRMQLIQGGFHLSDILIEVERMWTAQFLEKRVLLWIEVEKGAPDDLYGDQDKLKQILMNLVSNAAKYTEEGSVKLFAQVESAEDTEGDILSICVEDTGVGIRAEEIDKIFSLFTRASIEENRNKPGAGLGLKITEELTHIMGGTIRAESVYGEGSSFTVRVPVHAKEGKEDAREAFLRKEEELLLLEMEPPINASGRRFLVVDDTVVNLTVARGILSETGAMIDTAMSGPEAMALAISRHYDIVFLDHMMPEMDGLETLRQLRKIDGYGKGESAMVALTSNTEEDARAFYLKEGFDDYMKKPMREGDMNLLLKKYLGGRA